MAAEIVHDNNVSGARSRELVATQGAEKGRRLPVAMGCKAPQTITLRSHPRSGTMLIYCLDWFVTLPPTIRLTTDKLGVAIGPLVYGWMSRIRSAPKAVASPEPSTEPMRQRSRFPASSPSWLVFAHRRKSKRAVGRTRCPRPVRRVALPPFQAVYAGASGAIPGKLGETTEDQFDRVIGVNLGGTLLTVRKALPLIKDGGSIILKG